ncbi:MAG: hypothetical protein WBN28_14450 [Lutimonas sp.]
MITRKVFFGFLFLMMVACSDSNDDPNQILPNIPVNETVFLNNPEYINLQVVGGWAYTNGGISGIVVYRSGINNFVAFERSAPHLEPQACSVMVVRNSIIMQCSCDKSEFSILDGGPLTDGINVAARQYRTELQGGNVLRITNY